MRTLALMLCSLAICGCSDSGNSSDGGVLDGASGDGMVHDGAADKFVPFRLVVTVNEIPEAMNGSRPFTNLSGQEQSFRLTLPRHGFTLDVLYAGTLAVPSTLELTASVAIGEAQAGTNLASRCAGKDGKLSWKIPATMALPVGPITFKAKMHGGHATLESSLTVDIAEKTFLLDPFRLEDTWLLVLSQDLYTIERRVDAAGGPTVNTTVAPNGLPDFDEDLRLLGFGTAKMLASAAATTNYGARGTNAIVRQWVLQEMLKGLRRIFLLEPDGRVNDDSVRIRFVLEEDSAAPKRADFQAQVLTGGETAKRFSMIAIGGGDPSRGYLGLSKVDYRNVENEDDVGPKYGVFTTVPVGMMLALMGTSPMVRTILGAYLESFLPELEAGGRPVGENPLDAEILAAGFEPAKATAAARDRYEKLTFLVQTLGRLAATLTAHEIGHSLGLVPDGPPPYGLFGGEKNASFVNPARTASLHIDTPSFNVMQQGSGSGAALDVTEFLTEPRFNELNLAYLRGRLLVLPRAE